LARAEAADYLDACELGARHAHAPQAARFARWSFLASRVAFWLSFPMLFFMGAAEHYPFLSGIGH